VNTRICNHGRRQRTTENFVMKNVQIYTLYAYSELVLIAVYSGSGRFESRLHTSAILTVDFNVFPLPFKYRECSYNYSRSLPSKLFPVHNSSVILQHRLFWLNKGGLRGHDIVACRPVAKQRPQDKKIYDGRC
jgi:hypothetical protein